MHLPNPLRLTAIAWLLMLLLVPAAIADDDQPLSPEEQARIERMWRISWRKAAAFYLKHEDRYVQVPGYDRNLPSSTGMTVRDYQKKTAMAQQYTDARGKEQTRTLVKPDDEARAAVSLLPEVAEGKYGYIHSGNITQITSDKSMVLEDIWLLDASAVREQKTALHEDVDRKLAQKVEEAIADGLRRYKREIRQGRDGVLKQRRQEKDAIDWAFEDREDAASRQRSRPFSSYKWNIVGYRTDRLTEDKRWPAGKAADKGLQIIIVQVDGREVTAVPAATIGRGVSESQFLIMLAAQKINKAKFVDLITEAKRASRIDYIDLVLAALRGEEVDFNKSNDRNGNDAKDGNVNDAVELAD